MRAREKLNAAVIWACVVVAGLFGAALDSWVAFWGLLFLLVVGSHHAGAIRPHPDSRQQGHKPKLTSHKQRTRGRRF